MVVQGLFREQQRQELLHDKLKRKESESESQAGGGWSKATAPYRGVAYKSTT